jgi:hypothetical protein
MRVLIQLQLLHGKVSLLSKSSSSAAASGMTQFVTTIATNLFTLEYDLDDQQSGIYSFNYETLICFLGFASLLGFDSLLNC